MRILRTLILLSIVIVLAVACGKSTPSAAPAITTPLASASPEITSQPANPPVIESSQGTVDSLVAGTLGLQNVKMTLSITQPDGKLTSLEAEVDSQGNQHLVKTYPESQTPLFENGAPNPPATIEMYVVGGVAYAPDETGKLSPANDAGAELVLQSALLSPDGPGFWLKVLPAGSLTSQGEASYGGFQALEYLVQGKVEATSLTGSLWVSADRQALLGATLDIPASLAGPQTQGTLHIEFQVEQANIAPIQPDISKAVPTTTSPTSQITPASAGLPADVPFYSGAVMQVAQPGMLLYQVSASVEQVQQFYQQQLTANGWAVSGEPINTGGSSSTSWVKGEVTIMITISPDGSGGSMVSILLE